MTFDDEKAVGIGSATCGAFLLLCNFDFDPNWTIVVTLLSPAALTLFMAILMYRKQKRPTSAFYLFGSILFACLTIGLSYMAFILAQHVLMQEWLPIILIAWSIILYWVYRAALKARPKNPPQTNQGKFSGIAAAGSALGGFLAISVADGQVIYSLFSIVNAMSALWMCALASLCLRNRGNILENEKAGFWSNKA